MVDGFGRVLYQGEISTNSTGGTSLPNFDLPAGMYRIRLIGEDYRQNFNVAIIQ